MPYSPKYLKKSCFIYRLWCLEGVNDIFICLQISFQRIFLVSFSLHYLALFFIKNIFETSLTLSILNFFFFFFFFFCQLQLPCHIWQFIKKNDGYPHILLDICLYMFFIMKMSGTMTGVLVYHFP